jgi:hypothetical protein
VNYLRPHPANGPSQLGTTTAAACNYSRTLATDVASTRTRPPASLAAERVIRYVSVQNRPTVRTVFYEIRRLGAIPAIGALWAKTPPVELRESRQSMPRSTRRLATSFVVFGIAYAGSVFVLNVGGGPQARRPPAGTCQPIRQRLRMVSEGAVLSPH